MAKQPKYPKKFRQKLERMREERDEREVYDGLKNPEKMTRDELMDATTSFCRREQSMPCMDWSMSSIIV